MPSPPPLILNPGRTLLLAICLDLCKTPQITSVSSWHSVDLADPSLSIRPPRWCYLQKIVTCLFLNFYPWRSHALHCSQLKHVAVCEVAHLVIPLFPRVHRVSSPTRVRRVYTHSSTDLCVLSPRTSQLLASQNCRYSLTFLVNVHFASAFPNLLDSSSAR